MTKRTPVFHTRHYIKGLSERTSEEWEAMSKQVAAALPGGRRPGWEWEVWPEGRSLFGGRKFTFFVGVYGLAQLEDALKFVTAMRTAFPAGETELVMRQGDLSVAIDADAVEIDVCTVRRQKGKRCRTVKVVDL